MEVYDVIVIGAGPAGGSAALNCARQGLKTAILEEHNVIGEPVHCGECLSLLCVEKLELGIPKDAISLNVKGVRVIFPDKSEKLLTEKGFVLEKQKFEQWISREAKKAGAEVLLGKKVTAMQRENNTWTVTCSEETFKAKIVIDASGVTALTSRLTGLNPRFETVIGMQYELQDIPADGYLDFYIWPKLAPHGYLWMIPKNNRRANVGLVTNDRTKTKKYLDEFVKEMGWENKVNVKAFGGLIPAGGPVQNTYSDGLILVGDAAGFTSPLFEGGTHLGIKSGILAAQVAKEAIDKDDTSKKTLAKYEKLWKTEFPPYAEIVKGKNKLYELTDEEINRMAALLPDDMNEIDSLYKAKIGASLLAKNRDLLKKGVIDAYFALQYSKAQYYGW